MKNKLNFQFIYIHDWLPGETITAILLNAFFISLHFWMTFILNTYIIQFFLSVILYALFDIIIYFDCAIHNERKKNYVYSIEIRRH